MPAPSPVLLVAESGATKTEWRCLKGNGVIHSFQSGGFNPNTQSPAGLRQELTATLMEGTKGVALSEIHFYGAGLGSPTPREQVREVLQAAMPQARIEVFHDLLAAVRSTGRARGMLGILGTGSNACLFEKDHILERRGGLGYLIGDEGSGTDVARTLVKALIEGHFSSSLSQQLWTKLDTDAPGLIRRIYGAPRPHAFLSSLMPTFRAFVAEPEVRQLIIARFLAFLDSTVCQWPVHTEWPLCMVGGIAYHFEALLREACELRHVPLAQVDPAPIEGLVRYHLLEKR